MHNEPSSFEEELQISLRRVEAPRGFAEGVLRRLQSEPAQEHAAIESMRPKAAHAFAYASQRSFHRLAATLLLVLLVPFGSYLYQRRQQAQAEKAAQQFTLAMRLTHAALLDAGQQIAEHAHTRNAD